MPKFVKKSTPEQERSYCNKDAVFLGLFGDSSSPSVPSIGVSSSEMIADKELENM